MKKLAFNIADAFLALIILEILLHYLLPIKQIIFSPYNYMGIILFVIGWIPNIWLGIHFREIGTSISSKEKPKKLIINGLFRLSRNPNYLGMAIALFGEAIFLGSLITFILPIIFIILIDKLTIPYEEKAMEKSFESKYLKYKKTVRRWI